jgi:hypothetical protein
MDDTLYDIIFQQSIKMYLKNGHSPNKLLNNIYNLIDKEINTNETKMILYNACYGGFGFSRDFSDFAKSHGEDLTNDREDSYYYIELYAKHYNITINQALEQASGEYSKLKVKEIPIYKNYRIHEYDGNENIEILNDSFSI